MAESSHSGSSFLFFSALLEQAELWTSNGGIVDLKGGVSQHQPALFLFCLQSFRPPWQLGRAAELCYLQSWLRMISFHCVADVDRRARHGVRRIAATDLGAQIDASVLGFCLVHRE